MMGIHAGDNTCGVWGWSVFVEVLYQHAGVCGISAHPSLPLLLQQAFKRHLKPQANICGQPRPTGTVGSRKDEEDFPTIAERSQGPEAVESGVRCIPSAMNSKEA